MPILDIHHVTVKTQDLEATDKFYTEVLGMSFADRPDLGVPGSWYDIQGTMVHVLAGEAGVNQSGEAPYGGEALDHVALMAHDFDEMKTHMASKVKEWREFSPPNSGLWQLFVHDPNGVLWELNFVIANEPEGAQGPSDDNPYVAGQFYGTKPI